MATQKHRLVTRSDFDGLVCGMLLRELDLIDEIKFVHPKDMQDGIVPITARDIVTNLGVVQNRVTREAGLALSEGMMAPCRFQVWWAYGSMCWRSGEAARG